MDKIDISLYGATWCIHCTNAKNWLEENGFTFKFKNVENAEHLETLKSYNVSSIPFSVIKYPNGEEKTFKGFRQEEWREAITERK